MNKEEFEQALDRIYELSKKETEIEAKIKMEKEPVLRYMLEHGIPTKGTDKYVAELTSYVRYGVPTADKLREVLGKAAENYITEVVDTRVRKELPPQLSVKLCPVEKETPYVKMIIRSPPKVD